MKYKWNRRLEAWKYGAGLDYKFSPPQMTNTEAGAGTRTSWNTWTEATTKSKSKSKAKVKTLL